MYDNDEGSHCHACSNHDTADYECATLQSSLLSCLSPLNSLCSSRARYGVTGNGVCCPSSLQLGAHDIAMDGSLQ